MNTDWVVGKIKWFFGWDTKKPEARLVITNQWIDPVIPTVDTDNPTEVVSLSTQKIVESVMEWNNIQKLRYFLIELIRKNTGITTPSIEIWSSNKSISVKIPWKYKNWKTIQSIILEEWIRLKQVLTDSDRVKIWDMVIKLEESYTHGWWLTVTLAEKLDERNMELLRVFFEQVFMPAYMINENNILNSTKIRRILELWSNDFISINDTTLEVSIPIEHEILINKKTLQQFAMNLNNSYEDYSVKYKNTYNVWANIIMFWEIIIHDMNSWDQIYLHGEYKDQKLTIRIGNQHEKLKINKKFIETIFKKALYLLMQSTSKQIDPIQSLKDMGIIVYEKTENEPKKSLTDLYIEEWFMWYEDIKDLLAANIIHPWQQKEAYVRIANEEFPHVKNIIPNTALFEWPPGTGKTTQAKIIGKYLGYPFIYIPIGKLMSKWYGESEWRLDKIFELAWKAAKEQGWIIMMIDEIDEIWWNREKSHEATARMTGVLLKKLDGIEQIENILLIGSTNRKDYLDPALLSRFSRQVFFRLPDANEIRHIFSLYIPAASTLNDDLFVKLVWKSGRDIKNIAEDIVRIYMQEIVILKEKTNVEKVLNDYLEWLNKSAS